MKLAVSIMISLSVILIVMAMVIVLIQQQDFDKSERFVQQVYGEENLSKFRHVDFNDFTRRLNDYWPECNGTMLLYVKGEGELNKARIFAQYRNLSWCDDLQSAEHSCGVREDTTIQPQGLPAIVKVDCKNGTMHIE